MSVEVGIKWSGKEFVVKMDPTDTVLSLKHKLESETSVLAKRQKVMRALVNPTRTLFGSPILCISCARCSCTVPSALWNRSIFNYPFRFVKMYAQTDPGAQDQGW